MPATYDSVLANRFQRIIDAQIPAGVLSVPVPLYRTASGRKWHADGTAHHLTLYRHPVVLPSVFLGDLCSCVQDIGGAAVQYLQHAEFILRARAELAGVATRPPVVADIAVLRSLQRQAREHARDGYLELSDLMRQIVSSCHTELTADRMSDLLLRERDLLLHRWWRETAQTVTGSNSYSRRIIPPHDAADLAVFTTSTYHPGTEPLEAAWKVWGAAIDAGADAAKATAEAEDAGRRRAGAEPVLLNQVPHQSDMDASQFPSPAAWVRSAWRQERDRVLCAVVRSWQEASERAVGAGGGERELVFLNVSAVPERRRVRVEQAVSVYGGADDGECWLLSVPAMGAERLAALLAKDALGWQVHQAVGFERLGPADGAGLDVLETALQLWEDEEYEVPMAEQLNRARLIHS